MSVSMQQVLGAAAARRASVVGEMAAYLVLGAADQLVQGPRVVGPEHVALGEDGTIRVTGGAAAAPADAERSLRDLLFALLGVARSPSAAIERASSRPSGAGVEALIRELEAALIPVNRAAARRALARLNRETLRAGPDLPLVATPLRTAPPPPPVVAVAPPPVAAAVPPPVVAEAPPPRPIVALRELTPPSAPVRAAVAAPPPAVVEVASRAAAAAPEPVHTPPLGSFMEVVSARIAVPEPPLELAGADATEPMPATDADDDDPWMDALGEQELAHDFDSEPPAPLDEPSPLLEEMASAPRSNPSNPAIELSPASLARSVLAVHGASWSERPPAMPPPPPVEPPPPAVTADLSRLARPPSDVTDLVASFGVAGARSERELARDLKNLAGLDPTPPPPGSYSATPPPVAAAVDEPPTNAPPHVRRRMPLAALGVLGGLLALGGALGMPRGPSARAVAAAAVLQARNEPVCQGVLRVKHAPAGAELRVRGTGKRGAAAQSAAGPEASFSGLPCREELEVMLRDASGGAWRRYPVAASALTPAADDPAHALSTLDLR